MPILAGPGSAPRLLGPDDNNRLVYIPTGGSLKTGGGLTATVYADPDGLTLADITAYQPTNPGVPGVTIAGSVLTVGTDSQLPQFWYPAGLDTVWVQVGNGALVELHADYDARLDGLSDLVAAGETPAGAQAKVNAHAAQTTSVHGIANTALLETTAGAQAKANAAQAAAIAASDPVGAAAAAQAAAAADATGKANAAISAAAADATTKANTAQGNAISAAAADATTKANAVLGTAAGLAIVFGGL